MTTSADPIGIAELSRRTGLTQQTIRAWESRFGFPAPRRSEGGRREYADADVETVRRVLALKSSGVRLATAVARVRDEDDGPSLSIYGELRRRHPHLESRLMHRPALVALSRAIEDEAMSLAGQHHVFGAFQRERFYLGAEHRWREIARTASSCLVFADFPSAARTRRSQVGEPVRIALPADAPLLREWAVVVMGSSLSVALTAWEAPGAPDLPSAQRELEAMLTFDPAAVRSAVDICLASARAAQRSDRRTDQGTDSALLDRIGEAVAPERRTGAAADRLLLRVVSYLAT